MYAALTLPPMRGCGRFARGACERTPCLSEWCVQLDTRKVSLGAAVVTCKFKAAWLVHTTTVANGCCMLQVLERVVRCLPYVDRIPSILRWLDTEAFAQAVLLVIR